MAVNTQIREAVRQQLKKRDMTQAELAEKVGMIQPNVSRLLNGSSGQIPETWTRVLDALGLELIAVPKGGKP